MVSYTLYRCFIVQFIYYYACQLLFKKSKECNVEFLFCNVPTYSNVPLCEATALTVDNLWGARYFSRRNEDL